MVQTADTIWRDYVTDGVPSSGENDPDKAEIRKWGTYVENGILGAAAGATIYDSKADMDADTSHAANAMAWVLGDATAANNGVYQFDGTSTWIRLGDLPYSYIVASNAGTGTANAIVATTSIPIPAADGAALIALPIVVDNDASPVTVVFNGGSALTIKTSSGNDIATGGLVAGMVVAGYVSGSTFRLLSDQASEAILPAAEAVLAEFRTIYLGAFDDAHEPTTDLEGNALVVGAEYFNTDSGTRKTWDGSEWLDVDAPPDGSVTDVKVAPDAAINADKLAIAFDYTVPPAVLPISTQIKNGFAMPDWAKKESDGSNWQPAIQRIADALAGESVVGGVIDLGRGSKNVDGTITLTGIGTSLVGRGGGDFMNIPSAANPAPSTLVGVATAGDVVRVETYGCTVRGMQITADSTRGAASYAIGKGGLRLEATDTGIGLERVGSSFIDDVRVINQPGDGILVIGEAVGTVLSRSEGGGNKGHGICIDGGERTSRTNIARPGIIDLYMCRAQRNGGHGLIVGSSASVAESLPYRVRAYSLETFGNADDASVRLFDAAVWGYGENLEFNLCAFGGLAADGTVDAHDGFYLAGSTLRLLNNRYISVSKAGTIGQRTIGSKDVVIDGAYIAADTTIPTAFTITNDVQDIFFRLHSDTDYTNLYNTSVTGCKVTTCIDGVWTFPS